MLVYTTTGTRQCKLLSFLHGTWVCPKVRVSVLGRIFTIFHTTMEPVLELLHFWLNNTFNNLHRSRGIFCRHGKESFRWLKVGTYITCTRLNLRGGCWLWFITMGHVEVCLLMKPSQPLNFKALNHWVDCLLQSLTRIVFHLQNELINTKTENKLKNIR